MEVFEPGDRFATINREGRVLVWRVDEDGLARVQPETTILDNRPHSRACGVRRHDHGPECSIDCPTCGVEV
jgi:hypothetical protein